MEPVSTSILAALGAGSSLASLFSPQPTPVVQPGPGPAPLPGAPVGLLPGHIRVHVGPIDAAKHALQMNPSGMPPTAETSQIIQALSGAAPQAGNLLDAARNLPGVQNPGAPQAMAGANRTPQAAPNGQAPTPSQTPAPGAIPQGKSMASVAAEVAKNGPQKSTLLGLDGDQWGAIGVASGILAQLFKPGPQQQVLSPGGGGPGAIPYMSLGGDLSSGSQHLGTTSQFAINSPSIGGAYGAHTSDLLKALQGLG